MTTDTLDPARVEEFAGTIAEALNSAALALQVSIGHEVGLFDAMAGMSPSASAKIAAEAGLDERYVREWLGALTMGGIVEYDPEAMTYVLPPEHAAVLTRAAGPDNLARTTRFIPLLARVEPSVVEAFHNGGGVPYSEYTTFHATMAEESGEIFDAALIDTILPLVEGIASRLEEGIDVADIGCGRGRAVNLMAHAYPNSSLVGYDFSEEAIEVARAEAESMGLDNARFEVLDVAELDVQEAFDFITAFDAIHDQAQPTKVLANIYGALRPNGRFLMVDIGASSHLEENFDYPLSTFLYTVSTMHCMSVSLALGGEGLGTVWGRQRALGMLDDAGFVDMEVHRIDSDLLNVYFVARK